MSSQSTISHGTMPRGLDSVPRSELFSGRFGRLFRQLAPFRSGEDDLRLLASSMIEPKVDVEKGENSPSNNKTLPAGFTYFGQFIDHDLTFDPTSSLQRDNDPEGLNNFRTPRFDLDSVYGRGPDEPFLYSDGVRFLIGKNLVGEDDLPRNPRGVALIGDPRNDENLIVSQIHLAFLKYHNKVVDELSAAEPGLTGKDLFEKARQVVRWHYQWIVLHDFLPRIVGHAVVDDILRHDDDFTIAGPAGQRGLLWRAELKFFNWKEHPFMPVEFSVAAYRFGHSLVRDNYGLNTATAEDEVDIFDTSNPTDPNADDLRGGRFRPANRQIEWRFFFELPSPADVIQITRAIDTQIVFALGGLPLVAIPDGQPPRSLPERNLLRGLRLGLPSGQDVARLMGIPENLIVSTDNPTYKFAIGTNYKLGNGTPDPSVPVVAPADRARLEAVFGRQTPLWYYTLKEAELIAGGEILGPVGGRIVAEVFIGVIFGDRFSYIRSAPSWKPVKGRFGAPADGKFSMANLVQFVQ